jgi:hypothetical protein
MSLPLFVVAYIGLLAFALAAGYVAGFIDGWGGKKIGSFFVRIVRRLRG